MGKPLLLLAAANDDSGARGDLGESKGVELGVELGVVPEVNCQTRVNLVISSGMARGFFTTIPTATGSTRGEKKKILIYHTCTCACIYTNLETTKI